MNVGFNFRELPGFKPQAKFRDCEERDVRCDAYLELDRFGKAGCRACCTPIKFRHFHCLKREDIKHFGLVALCDSVKHIPEGVDKLSDDALSQVSSLVQGIERGFSPAHAIVPNFGDFRAYAFLEIDPKASACCRSWGNTGYRHLHCLSREDIKHFDLLALCDSVKNIPEGVDKLPDDALSQVSSLVQGIEKGEKAPAHVIKPKFPPPQPKLKPPPEPKRLKLEPPPEL
ncbi:hypothetical protein T492DRAFT_832913 [Pavlovales sp. CCMP2436]|nr:hypothetical protein T492DRAFT_832913 [Pavlovales sp. CCMP2436]